MPNPAEILTEMGAPNNIYTRTIYRVIFKLTCLILHVSIKIASIVTRKDKWELLDELIVKLGGDPINPM